MKPKKLYLFTNPPIYYPKSISNPTPFCNKLWSGIGDAISVQLYFGYAGFFFFSLEIFVNHFLVNNIDHDSNSQLEYLSPN